MQYQQLKKHIKSTGSTENVMLIAPKSTKDFRKSINLSKRQSKKKLSLSNDGVVISEKLANILNVKKGSTITLTNSHGKNYRFKVSAICEMYLGHYIFMNQKEYRKTIGNYHVNAYLVTMRKRSLINKVSRQLVKTAAIETVVSNSSNKNLLGSFTGSLNEVIFILILISGMLAIVVIYNLTNMNESASFQQLKCSASTTTKPRCTSIAKRLFYPLSELSSASALVGGCTTSLLPACRQTLRCLIQTCTHSTSYSLH